MSTIRQKKLAKQIVNNLEGKTDFTAGQMLENVGYSEHLVKQPGRIIQSEGVQEELARLGFTEFDAKKVTASIMNNESEASIVRLKAADMTFKVHNSYGSEGDDKRDLTINVFNFNADNTSLPI